MLLTIGERKPHTEEPENLWVFRLLGIKPTEGWSLEIDANDITRLRHERHGGLSIEMLPDQLLVLKSWMDQKPDHPKKSVAIVIEGPQGFLLHLKNKKLPNPKCWHKLSLIGGMQKLDENPRVAMMRRLHEEVRSRELVEHVVHLMKPMGSMELTCPHTKTIHECTWFLSYLDNPTQFVRWIERFLGSPGLSSDDSAFLTHEEILPMVLDEDMFPGSEFNHSHHKLIEHLFQQ
ncbi:MAG: hypothetical protein UT32_C0038G0001 [Parcubacteria group bacterium GW2011_GWC2_39_14]|nr:MAG: hypothetical protein UT32_C0038G0001 [Parcubacteria group bacterium GW2011_GWC2_39_14]